MASRTLTQIRQAAGRLISVRTFYGTAGSTGNTTTNLRDSDTRRFPTGFFTGCWLMPTSGTDSGLIFYVTAFSQTNGDFTVIPAASGAAVFDLATFEVTPYPPDAIPSLIYHASRQLYPSVARTIVDDSFNTSSPLWNGGFEEWTSASVATGWTASTSTLARSTTSVPTGQYMARLTGGAGYLGLSTAQRLDISHLAGQSVTVYAYVLSNTTSDCRLRLVDSTGTVATGSYHGGGSDWEVLSVTGTLATTKPNAFDIRILKDSATSTIDIERVWVDGPRLHTFRVPVTMARGVQQVYVAAIRDRAHFAHYGWLPASFRVLQGDNDADDTGTRRLELLGEIPAGRAMMIVGQGPLNELSAEGDEAELDDVASELLELQTALNIISSTMSNTVATDTKALTALYARLMIERDRIMGVVREPAPGVFLPRDT